MDGVAHLSGELFPKRFPVYFHVGYDKRFLAVQISIGNPTGVSLVAIGDC